MQFLEKLCKISESIEILNLQKKERRRNYLVSEPNYHTTKCFTENLKKKKKEKTKILMNKPVFRTFNTRTK